MENFPEDLLAGVYPLVFAVDAIQAEDGESGSKSPRFNKFLDGIAAALVDEDPDQDKRKNTSLFRNESEEDSDDGLETTDTSPLSRKQRRAVPGFGRRANSKSSISTDSNEAYAKNLNQGQRFFERARVEAIGAKRGFPPSKDPDGKSNFVDTLAAAIRDRDQSKIEQFFRQKPVDGILPAGWMEKHVHALPSVILVVCGVSSSRPDQEAQDKRLFETIEHLRYSLVPKRKCTIHIVGLLEDDVSIVQGDVWSRTISSDLLDQEGKKTSDEPLYMITLLHVSSDLQGTDTGMPTSPALKQLHRAVRDASLEYYLFQARRTKEKLSKLRSILSTRDSGPTRAPELFPLMIKYCFKIALFYEFQLKSEKSLRFMNEGYRYAGKYFQFLYQTKVSASPSSLEGEKESETRSIAESEGRVEVTLAQSGTSTPWWQMIPSPPEDAHYQCRAVAEWINLKVLTAALASRTESGRLAAADQWRDHSRVFCSRRLTRPLKSPAWFDWVYISRQCLVFSQLVERNPQSSDVLDDSLECSLWRTYEAVAESLLQLSAALVGADQNGASKAAATADTVDPMRPRFVGGIGKGDLGRLREEAFQVASRGTY